MKKLILSIMLFTSLSTAAHAQSSPDFTSFPKWERVIENEKVTHIAPKPESILETLKKVQKHYQSVPYVEDAKNYGVSDYWATRAEMKKKGSGDCEDFAISEYFDLLEAGVPENDMLISIVMTKETQELHAYLQVNGYVLDRRFAPLLTQEQAAKLYTPIYSINRLKWQRD